MESKVLKKITKHSDSQGFPTYYSSGLTKDGHQYIVMDKLGLDLNKIRKNYKKHCFSLKTTVQVGMQLLDSLEALHSLGYIHTDLKPENILVGSRSMISAQSSKIVLIDFGLARPYKSKKVPHIEETPVKSFRGSMCFASINAFKYLEQSRRDDLISLVYNLVYFARGKSGFE